MPIADVIQSVYNIAKLVYDQAQLAKANKAQCRSLSSRVNIAVTAIKDLEKVKDSEQYMPGLKALETCLQECLVFITTFSKKNWVKNLLKGGTYKERFEELNEQLQKAIQQLNLGLVAQLIINREQDKKDEIEDNMHIQNQQAFIIQLNQEANQQLRDVRLAQEEQKAIYLNQFASIKARIAALDNTKIQSKPLIDHHLLLPYYELTFHEKVMEGIYRGDWNEQRVAIKALEMDSKIMDDDMAELTREVQIMSRLRNPYIVQLYGVCLEPQRPCLVMEYMEKGSLEQYLQEAKLEAGQKKQIALDIAKGLSYLHQQHVFHRDLKSANVLINYFGQAKLHNFGLAKIKSNSVKTIIKKSESSASVAWQAPECLQKNNVHSEKSDVYSFGIILWEIMTSKKPYQQYQGQGREKRIIEHVLAAKRETISQEIPEFYSNLIQACWDEKPERRPDVQTIIRQLEAYQPVAELTGEEYYQRGISYEKENKQTEAYAEYLKASRKDYYKAYTNIGFFSLKGIGGVKEDKSFARDCFLKATEKGHARAMYNIARMFEQADGVDKDVESAKEWYKKAMDAGDKEARKKYDTLSNLQTANYQNNLNTNIK